MARSIDVVQGAAPSSPKPRSRNVECAGPSVVALLFPSDFTLDVLYAIMLFSLTLGTHPAIANYFMTANYYWRTVPVGIGSN
jgi:hypothetical protein